MDDEKPTVEQVLQLASQLAPEDQEILSEEFAKLKELRRRCAEAEASLDRAEGIPAEVVFAELEAQYKRRKAT